jgi:hypothetical protein
LALPLTSVIDGGVGSHCLSLLGFEAAVAGSEYELKKVADRGGGRGDQDTHPVHPLWRHSKHDTARHRYRAPPFDSPINWR